MEKQISEPGNLGSLSLNHWYKFLLYLGGAIFIIGLYFYFQYPLIESYEPGSVYVVIVFAIFTILIGVSLWILDEVLYYVEDRIIRNKENQNKNYERAIKKMMTGRVIAWIIMFSVWLIIALMAILHN